MTNYKGELICPECNGSKVNISQLGIKSILCEICRYCLGKGKLDWVENLTGKTNNELMFFRYYIENKSSKTIYIKNIDVEIRKHDYIMNTIHSYKLYIFLHVYKKKYMNCFLNIN